MPEGECGAITNPIAGVDAVEAVRAGKYDIIHIHDPFIPFVAWNIATNAKSTIVTTFHTCWNDTSLFRHVRFGLRLVSGHFCRYVDGVIYVSAA